MTEETGKKYKRANVTLERAPSRIKVERLLAMLSEREHTNAEIAEGISVSIESAHRYVKFLIAEKKIYVKRWERAHASHGGMPTAYYAAGDKPSTQRPKPLTKEEQSRRAYKRMKTEDPAKYAAYLDRARTKMKMRNRAAKGVPLVPADPMLAWIPRRAA